MLVKTLWDANDPARTSLSKTRTRCFTYCEVLRLQVWLDPGVQMLSSGLFLSLAQLFPQSTPLSGRLSLDGWPWRYQTHSSRLGPGVCTVNRLLGDPDGHC